MDEYVGRRNKMLTYYPDVARAGNLANALTQAFAGMGSTLTAYSPVSPEEPIWSSPFSGHPEAPGTTVPEFATAKRGTRLCQVIIGWFDVRLGSFNLVFSENRESHLGFLEDEDDESSETIVNQAGSAEAQDLATTANIIRGALETRADLGEIARQFGVEFRPTHARTLNPDEAKRFLEPIFKKLGELDRNK